MSGLLVLAMLKAIWEWAGPVLATVAANEISRRMRVRRWRRMGAEGVGRA